MLLNMNMPRSLPPGAGMWMKMAMCARATPSCATSGASTASWVPAWQRHQPLTCWWTGWRTSSASERGRLASGIALAAAMHARCCVYCCWLSCCWLRRLLLGHSTSSPLALLLLRQCRYLALIYTDQLVGAGAVGTAIGSCTNWCLTELRDNRQVEQYAARTNTHFGPHHPAAHCLPRWPTPAALPLQSEPAKHAAWETHCDPSTTGARNGGAHFAYLAQLAERCGGEGGWAAGSQLSIADILLFDIVDLFLRVYGEQVGADRRRAFWLGWAGPAEIGIAAGYSTPCSLTNPAHPPAPTDPPAPPPTLLQFKAAYPGLVAIHELVAGVPGVKAYLEGPLRLEKVNNNGLG